MANNRDMRVRLSLDAASFQSGLKEAMQSITDFKSKAMEMGQIAMKLGKAYVKLGTDSIKWFGNMLKTVVSVSAKIGAAVGGISIAAVKTAADFQALDSMFKETFGNLTNTATQAMEKMAKETGIVSGRLKQGFTDMFMQLKGSGIEAKEALGLTEKGMRLAADAAAAYNIPLEDAVSKLRSFIRGNTEAGDSIGLFTSETQRNEAAVAKYGKKWQELTEAQKQNLMLEISEKIYKESGAMGQAAREADNLENVLGNLKFSLKEFLATLGAGMLNGAISSLKEFGAALDETKNILKDQGLMAAVDYMTKFIASKMSEMAKNIPNAMSNVINAINGFISNSLPSLMSAGGQIVQSISQGIVSNQSQISSGISSLIGQISNWINENMPSIEAAGRSIIDAIKTGIENNKDAIGEAVYNITKTAVSLFLEYKSMIFEAGLQVGGEFLRGVWDGIKEWNNNSDTRKNSNWYIPPSEDVYNNGKEVGTTLANGTNNGVEENKSGFWTNFMDFLTCGGYTANKAKEEGQTTGKALGDSTVQGAEVGLSELSPATARQLEAATRALQQSATNMYNGAKYSFSQLGIAAKEEMTSMYKGVGTSMYMTAQKVRQEASNMYNGAKTSFVNLANVGRNQFSNLYNGASNSIRSLSHAVQGNMNSIRSAINIRSSVNSAISDFNRLRSALSRPVHASINISKTTTVSTISKPARMHGFAAMPFGLSSATSGAAMSSGKSDNSTKQNMTTIIQLDGKEIARQTAPYMDGALNTMTARRNRLGGAY